MDRRLTVGAFCAGALLGAALLAPGCNAVGPASLGTGRAAYGEVVTRTSDEQLLRAIVMDRFGQTVVLMAVTSVTANVSLRASAGGEVGIGPGEDYAGNLVPLSVGVAYEENPTISYVPVETPAYLQQMMSPLSLGEVLLLVRGAREKSGVLMALFERINGLTNPLVGHGDPESEQGFLRVIEILASLKKQGVTDMVSIRPEGYGLLIRVEALSDRSELREMLRLLELTDLLKPWGAIASGMAGGKAGEPTSKPVDATPKQTDRDDAEKQPGETGGLAEAEADVVEQGRRGVLVIPMRFSAAADGKSIAVMTRSVNDVVQLASSLVEVPEEQIQSGMAPPAAPSVLENSPVRIRRANRKPKDALVSTFVHGHWYYIENTDLQSKEFFRLLTGMWSAQLASAKSGAQAPVLTVGVSR